ncbi:MAG: endo-1,4-beta-xylanase [Ginsengibacter sp.]
MKNSIIFFVIIFTLCNTACKKNNTPATKPAVIDTTILKGISSFKMGAALDVYKLQTDAMYKKTVLEQLNSITIENAVKWPAVHPNENTFDFTGGGYIADFCVSNNKRLHGHCLIWYSANPDWLNNFVGDSLAWENLFKTHIQTVVGHYKGKATSWDVVNEAFRDDNGTLRVLDKNKRDNFDDGCIWARHLGNDYLSRAFKYAQEADPAALLFYNEYGQEWSAAKTDAIVNMVNDFKSRGIPINGLGLQMHIDIHTSEGGIATAIQKLSATGLLIHISELNISVNPSNDQSLTFRPALQTIQANKYTYIATQYKKLVPANQQYGITTWNVSDKDSLIRTYILHNDWPLLFDDNYARKPCYYNFREALKIESVA